MTELQTIARDHQHQAETSSDAITVLCLLVVLTLLFLDSNWFRRMR